MEIEYSHKSFKIHHFGLNRSSSSGSGGGIFSWLSRRHYHRNFVRAVSRFQMVRTVSGRFQFSIFNWTEISLRADLSTTLIQSDSDAYINRHRFVHGAQSRDSPHTQCDAIFQFSHKQISNGSRVGRRLLLFFYFQIRLSARDEFGLGCECMRRHFSSHSRWRFNSFIMTATAFEIGCGYSCLGRTGLGCESKLIKKRFHDIIRKIKTILRWQRLSRAGRDCDVVQTPNMERGEKMRSNEKCKQHFECKNISTFYGVFVAPQLFPIGQ